MKLVVHFSEVHPSMSDYKVDSFMESIKHLIRSNVDKYICFISNALALDAIRVLIKEEEIDHKDVTIFIEGEEIDVDKNGTLREWPKCLDVQQNLLMRLL